LLYQRKSRGLVLGNYVILDKIGQGGMGMVFKARHRRMDRIVALKVLPPEVTKKPEAVQRITLQPDAYVEGFTADDLLTAVLEKVEVPRCMRFKALQALQENGRSACETASGKRSWKNGTAPVR
jgi:serine/threonine protein kinase